MTINSIFSIKKCLLIGFLLILGVENIAQKVADQKFKTEFKPQNNQGEDEDERGDTPFGMKLKISGIPGQGNVHKTNNHQDDHLTISVPTPSLKKPPSVSPCFSSKKVAQIRSSRYQLMMYYSVYIEKFKPATTRETLQLQLLD